MSKEKCKYLGENWGDCWKVSGNVFQKCISKNKEKCILLKNEQLHDKIDNLQQQLQTAKEENEKVRNILRQDYCLEYQPILNEYPPFETKYKQVFKFKGKTVDEWDNLTQQNKQMREALEKVKKDACCSNGDCEHCEYDEDCFGYDAQQALKGGE